VATVRNGKGAQQLRKNLRRVVPQASDAELDELVGEGCGPTPATGSRRSGCPKWIRAPSPRTPTQHDGAEHIDEATAPQGLHPGVAAHGQLGRAAIWLVAHGCPFTTVAERLKPESLFDRFVAYREKPRYGGRAADRRRASPAETLAARLRSGRGVCLLADRDLSRNGIEVEFFGEAARMPGGPALLAATTGAALLPVSLWFTPDGGWGQWIGPPVELTGKRLAEKVRAGTQALANVFQTRIAEHPSDWHMLQKLCCLTSRFAPPR